MKVLNLVTSPRPFFRLQVRSLEALGHTVDTVEVPGRNSQKDVRSHFDYLRFYISVLSAIRPKYDIIHANYGLTAPFALAQPIRPVVLTLWGSDLSGKYESVTKCCARFCDEVIVRSEEMNQKLEQEAHVIPAGIDLDQFKPFSKTEAREVVGWDTSKKHVLFPYSPSRSVKNYPLAERVVDRVNQRCQSDVLLHTVYGVNHDKVPHYMNAADALLLTSDREGSPNTVKEAMACNTPVVSTDVGDVAHRLSEVENSAVCKNESELVEELLSTLQSGGKSNGREKIRELSSERMSLEIANVYNRALR